MLGDCEAGVASARYGVGNLDVIDARARRAVVKRVFEPLDRRQLPFRRRLDEAVAAIAYPAVDAFARRRRFSEIAKADALHAAAD